MARTLCIISRFYAEETGTGFSITRTAEGLSRYYSVRVLCGQPDYLDHKRRAPSTEIVNNVRIYRSTATAFSNGSLVVKALNMFTSSISIFFLILKHVQRGQPVIVVNLPPLLPFMALPVCRLKGAQTVLLIHDVYPESLVVAGVLRRNSMALSLLEMQFSGLYRMADHIIVLGRDMQALIERKTHWVRARISVIPNTADIDEIHPKPRERNSLLGGMGLANKFVIRYAGHMGRTHDLKTIVMGAKILNQRDRDIHFIFAGSGPKKSWLEAEVGRLELQNTTITDFGPRSEIEESLNACDVGIISMLPGMAGISTPGRIYDLLAVGKPVVAITDANSEIALVIREEEVGWVADPEDVSGLVDIILAAKDNPEELLAMGRRARWVAENKYARRHQVEAYYHLIEHLPC